MSSTIEKFLVGIIAALLIVAVWAGYREYQANRGCVRWIEHPPSYIKVGVMYEPVENRECVEWRRP